MENPCYLVEGGELRRWRSLPVKSTVATVLRPEEYGGGSLKPQARKPQATLLSALLLATLITLAATAALVCLLRAVHTRYTPATVVPESWTGEMVVRGEFRVINEPYRPSLANITSPDFRRLAASIGYQLNKLFRESLLSGHYKRGGVVGLRSGLTVDCSLVLGPTDPLTVSKVGLAFLGGLRHAHGHLWLGPYTIDVQTIGFQASGEEVTWSEWSGWSDCNGSVRTRKRVCLSLSGAEVARKEACLEGSLQGVADTEAEPCLRLLPRPLDTTSTTTESVAPSTVEPSVQGPTTEQGSSTELSPQPPAPSVESWVTTTPPWADSVTKDTTNSTTEAGDREKRRCLECTKGEVCVALEGEVAPYCRAAEDPEDPTGCGGLCKINTELCYRLGQQAFRCVDDSKCLDDEWQCGNKLCIPSVKRCDGHFNCYDHTDEYNCECDLKTHFHCGKNSSCLVKTKKCDGIVDCWDAADEVNCTVACLDSAQFTCNDSQCISSKHFCDGFPDCNDHSDEPFGCGGVCKNHEWRCTNGRCIVRRDVCNGSDDCGDGSDEVKCGKRKNIL